MTMRHFVWFQQETGLWIGEWTGHVPSPTISPAIIGDARVMLLNEWAHQIQSHITPFASVYDATSQAWDLDMWDNCPDGGAVCLDVTMYGWPVGDFYWSVFDGVDRLIDFREMRAYLQLTPTTAMLDASLHSARPARSKSQKLVADVTGTLFEPWVDQICGQLVRRDGRILFKSSNLALPEVIINSITDQNTTLQSTLIQGLEPERIPEYTTSGKEKD